jgi:Heterokaryon incompatibility protein (HET)
MSFRILSTSLSHVRILLRRISLRVGSVLWISYLVITRTCYHLPRILLHRPQDGNPVILRQPLVSPNPVDEQRHQDLESYQYEPLPGHRYIRLLYRTGPRSGAEDEYGLYTLSLDDPIASRFYRAISYTWDGQVPDRFIVCSGKKLAITQNCEMILRAMRHRDNFLWIDAICIDSSCMSEKSSQILLMSNIYNRAFVVNIWLGEPTEGTSIVYSYFWLLWCCSVIPEPVQSWLEYHVHALMSGRFPSA